MGYTWTVTCNGTDISADVISARWEFGRQNYIDDYSANYCTITVRNDGGQFNPGSFPISSPIVLTPSGAFGPSKFWLQSIDYNDEIKAKASTAEIRAIDGFGRLGQVPIYVKPVSAGTTTYARTGSIAQMSDYFTTYQLIGQDPGGVAFTNQIGNPAYSGGDSQVLSMSNSGTADQTLSPPRKILDLINANIRTEGGVMDCAVGTLVPRSRYKMSYAVTSLSIGNAASTTELVWDEFSRTGYGGNYFNTVTTQSELTTLAPQTAQQTITTTGETQLNRTTRDTTEAKELGLAQWLSATLGSGTLLFGRVSFIDAIQNATALATWKNYAATAGRIVTVQYQTPGIGLETRKMMIEGGEVEVIPGVTRFTLYLSDKALYSFFTLDDANLGVLDSDRLAW